MAPARTSAPHPCAARAKEEGVLEFGREDIIIPIGSVVSRTAVCGTAGGGAQHRGIPHRKR